MSGPSHNLDIQEYSLEEVLGLFDLKSFDITIDDLKRAKKKVLMLHPDKSKLEAKYFLFYKKAFDVIIQFYDNQHRQEKEIRKESLAYDPNFHSTNKNTSKQITKTVNKMSSESFNDKFNELFENNHMGNVQDPSKNEWFKNEDSSFDLPQGIVDQEFNDIWHRIEHAKKDNSLDEDDKKLSDGELKKRYEKISKRRVKLAILLQYIAKEKKISVDEKELTNGMMSYTSQYPGQEKEIMEYFKKNPSAIETIRGPILEQKVIFSVFCLS